jgi:hypothetical protein
MRLASPLSFPKESQWGKHGVKKEIRLCRKPWRHLPAFPRQKGSAGDIPQYSPAGKEAWETSPEFNGG